MATPSYSKNRVSQKAASFTESVIREMSREAAKYNAVNLGQGFPDFAAPEDIKKRAQEAIAEDYNQYAITWGTKDFRDAIVKKTKWFLALDIDPETEITVTCGSTEGMIAGLLATVDPGEEVIVFEPFYENYAPDAILSDANPVYVALEFSESGWNFDPDVLRTAFNDKTKAIILCNPNNPTGKVFTREEMEFIAGLCIEFDVICFTDEIYEHILFEESEVRSQESGVRSQESGVRSQESEVRSQESEVRSQESEVRSQESEPRTANGSQVTERKHISMAQIDGMRERTVVVNSLSKTYSVTGWRVGYCIAPPDITGAIRKVHDFLTVGAAHPLQKAGAYALSLPKSYYTALQADYQRKRDYIVPVLQDVGLRCAAPEGAYYVMTDISGFGFDDDIEFTKHLIRDIGVAVVPGSSFYHDSSLGKQQVRFCFCKKDETLEAAAEALRKLT